MQTRLESFPHYVKRTIEVGGVFSLKVVLAWCQKHSLPRKKKKKSRKNRMFFDGITRKIPVCFVCAINTAITQNNYRSEFFSEMGPCFLNNRSHSCIIQAVISAFMLQTSKTKTKKTTVLFPHDAKKTPDCFCVRVCFFAVSAWGALHRSCLWSAWS